MPKSRTVLSLALSAVFVATFALGVALVPTPAAAQCELLVAQCPGIGCFSVRTECNCVNPGGQPRLEEIYYCDDDPSIIIGRQCTNSQCP